VFVAAGDQLEEQVRGVLIERDIAHFVNYEEPVAAQLGQFLGEFPAGVGFLEPGGPPSRSKRTSCPALAAWMPIRPRGCFCQAVSWMWLTARAWASSVR
jgi:hypothetical protein